MNKKQFIEELKKRDVKFEKVRFYKESPYQKRRYREKYVGWEAWIYTNTTPLNHGALITQEAWEYNKEGAIASLY